jgi:HK97 family phage prohead protease
MQTRLFTRVEVANMQAGMEVRDVWSTAYVNGLPDSAFLLVFTDDKGDKQRMFPYKDANGKVDVPHLNNAISRIPQASTLTADQRAAVMLKAKKLAAAHPGIGSGPTKAYEGTAGSGRQRPAGAGLQTRAFEVALELRADGDGRTVLGRAVPYGQTAQIAGGTERFVMGAFARQIAGGPDAIQVVKMHSSHSSRLAGEFPVGKTVHLAEQPDGLVGAWRMYDTPRGDEALHMVKTGEVTGLSIGFKALDGGTKKGADGAFERHAAHLDHVVLTGEPAYAGAQVTSVRSAAHPAAAYRTELLRARSLLERVRSG